MVAGKDLEKRKRVMQRSIRLGHCICDPKKACPCDVLKEQDCCPCAGERLAQLREHLQVTLQKIAELQGRLWELAVEFHGRAIGGDGLLQLLCAALAFSEV